MFFALEMTNLRNSVGEPTWAVYGTLKALFDAIEMTKPSATAVAFDLPEPSFRQELFEDYKANRPEEMPEELQAQWQPIQEAFRMLHIPVLAEPGLEADDMIGIMAQKADKAGYRVVILSGDKDLYQLVNDHIRMAVPQRGGGLKLMGAAEVFEQMGVHPKQIPDYKGIAGDSSDNIPGVKGLGPKTAVKLLEEFKTLEDIYDHIQKVDPPKVREKLIEQEDKARLSKHIATIITDESGVKHADLNIAASHLEVPDLDRLVAFLKKYEFNSILKRLPAVLKPFNKGTLVKVDVGDLAPKDPENPALINNNADLDKPLENLKVKPFIVLDESALTALIKQLEQIDVYSVDLETTGLNTLNCDIVGWALAFAESKSSKIKSFYIPVRHSDLAQLDPGLVLDSLKPILEAEDKLQIMQNAKFERKIFKRLGIKLHANFYDTMLASYLQNSSFKHGLKAQSKRVFHQRMTELEDIIGTGRKQISIGEAALDTVAAYAAADAYMTYKLYGYYQANLDDSTKKLLTDIELPLVDVLADMELAGISLDTKFFKHLSLELNTKIEQLQNNIFKIVGQEFNISSPKQLSNMLFDELKITPIGKKNKLGNYSTDADTLETFLTSGDLSSKQESFVKAIIEYRTLSKLASTYVDNLPNMIAKETGRLHSEFNQTGTATGRLSSSNPNLQNIPIRTDFGKLVRKGFIAKNDDYVLLSADYSQIELRILAHMANEKVLINAFNKGADIHAHTAAQILSKEESEVTDDERRIGKTLNFALIYMQGPYATAGQLGITLKEAKEFIDKYFLAFPNIKPFMDKVLKDAHRNAYVETMFGRRRYFQNINNPNKALAKEEERQAFNAVLQGTAADIVKKAMINLYTTLQDKKLDAKILLQVHDELVLEISKNNFAVIRPLVTDAMQSVVNLKVSLIVDISSGSNWLETK
jgi:DNA polymerase-1